MTDFENAGEIETTAGHRIKISDVAAGNGVSSSVGSSTFAVLEGSGTDDVNDGVFFTFTFNGTVRDPDGWLNGSTYESPDWEGASYLASQTILLPPGLYLVACKAQFGGSGFTSVDADFSCVDNRLATTLSDSWYAYGPAPVEDAQPAYNAAFNLGNCEAEHLIFVPTDTTPGLYFSYGARPHGAGATDWTAKVSIQKVSDWSAASA